MISKALYNKKGHRNHFEGPHKKKDGDLPFLFYLNMIKTFSIDTDNCALRNKSI